MIHLLIGSRTCAPAPTTQKAPGFRGLLYGHHQVMLDLVFLIIAMICFILAAFGVRAPWFHLGWLGLAFFAAASVF